MRDQRRSLLIFLALVSPVAVAQDSGQVPEEEAPKRLDELVVTAVPLRSGVDSLARPVEILAGAELDARKGNTLGETLSKLTGVQSSYFGPGVGRPIIRGLDGPRVQVLSGGVSSQDASTVSADHAVSIEPFLADQIEVLKSASSLLYGSSAIGGAVNVVDGRIPEQLTDGERGFTGRAELRGNTVNDESTGMLRLDGSGGMLAFHVDLLRRSTEDYEIPGFAESAARLAEEGETPDPDSAGLLENSSLTTTSGAVGASLIGERAFFGLSYSIFDTQYGIPGHEHGHDDEHEGEDHDEDHAEEEGEEVVRIDMQQKRLDAKFGLVDPLPGHERLSLRLANNRYEHTELEGQEIGTLFSNRGSEARLEAVHAPLAGWYGAYGLQYGRRDFSAVGEEAFVPASLTRDLGFFLFEEQQFDELKLELGARVERVKIEPAGGAQARFTTTNISAAGRWDVSQDLHLQLGLDAAERAPVAEELFADGPHLATQTFEIGNPDLQTEKSNRAEIGVHWHRERFAASAAAYRVDFRDFIYLVDTGEEEDELPVRVWTQEDARFTGLELEGKWLLADAASGRWDLRMFADSVRARLDAGGNLPRIAPARLGADLLWQRDGWRASVGALRYDEQDRLAEGETASDGYTLLDAHLSYSWGAAGVDWQVFLDGNNLGDREARPHTSFLKDVAPLPGRSLAFGVRAWF
jgi:iron complex outermembrane receptor protein